MKRATEAPSQTGITLVEILISLLIGSAGMAMALNGYSFLSANTVQQGKIAFRQMDLEDAFVELERDLKNTGADPLDQGLFEGEASMLDIVPQGDPLAGGLKLAYDQSGPNGVPDGQISELGEVIVYFWDHETDRLERWLGDGQGAWTATRLLEEVTEFTVEPLTSSGTPASTSEAVQVRVTLACRVSATDPRINAPIRSLRFNIALRH